MNQSTMTVQRFFFSQHLRDQGLCQSGKTLTTVPFSRGQAMQDCEACSQQTVAHPFITIQHSTICRKVESLMKAHEQQGIKHVRKPSDGVSVGSSQFGDCMDHLLLFKIQVKTFHGYCSHHLCKALSLWLQAFSSIIPSAKKWLFYLIIQSQCTADCRALVQMCKCM